LSDEGLEAAVDDRLSFRRFSGIPLDRPVPDHSSIWRFRQHLTRKDGTGLSLGERLLAAINRQLDEKGLVC
jgi:IS5 family transposase